jgi:hypothetical protein
MHALPLVGYWIGSLFDPEDGGTMFLQNANELLPYHMTLDPIVQSHSCKNLKFSGLFHVYHIRV